MPSGPGTPGATAAGPHRRRGSTRTCPPAALQVRSLRQLPLGRARGVARAGFLPEGLGETLHPPACAPSLPPSPESAEPPRQRAPTLALLPPSAF